MRTSTGIALAAADALDHALLQEAQQLGLQRQRHVADLVEKQRAAVGELELAGRLPHRAGEGALLVAEQLALEQRFRDGRAVDRDERLAGAAARARAARAPAAPCRCRSRRGAAPWPASAPPSRSCGRRAASDRSIAMMPSRGDARPRGAAARGSPPRARGSGTRAARSGAARRCRSASGRSRTPPGRPRARRCRDRRCPVTTITLVCGASARISLSVARPSRTPSGSGGSPRSCSTTCGSCLRSSLIASWRVEACSTSNGSKHQRSWRCNPGSSSTMRSLPGSLPAAVLSGLSEVDTARASRVLQGAAASGSEISKRVPTPRSLSTCTSPPAMRTNSRVWKAPMPIP